MVMKDWRYRKENIQAAERISAELNCGRLAGRLLAARGILTTSEAYDFLNPNLRSLNDPFLLKDMERAVERIAKTIKEGGKILVHGDYDADGITSTALMVKSLTSTMGEDRVEHFLPSRYGEGYGISSDRIHKAGRDGVDLIITVDCGIKAHDAALETKDLDIDLIITDHHEPGEKLPEAYCILDPKIEDSGYPFPELAGVGVAFKLALALQQRDLLLMDARDLLDLVALGTVADLVPLVGENRILVKYGLEKLRDTKSPGLISLMTESGIDIARGPSATDIAFKLGPRINSAGRMGDPDMALELLLTWDRVDADLFARELNTLNFKRKAVGSKLVQEIKLAIEETGAGEDPFIITYGRGWNPGVLGITANKIMESAARPVAVLSLEEETARGSIRAPAGYNLMPALEQVGSLLMEYGGHEKAAGITLRSENIEEVRKKLNEYTMDIYPDLSFVPTLDIDMDLSLEEIDTFELEHIERLQPFGTDNPSPIISIRDAMIGSGSRTVGDGKHLKFCVEEGPSSIDCIYFNGGEFHDQLRPGMLVSIAGEPSIHRWRGRETLQLRVVDIRIDE